MGRAAKKPNCEGKESWIEAACWFTARASEVDSSPWRIVHPGAVRERIVVLMP